VNTARNKNDPEGNDLQIIDFQFTTARAKRGLSNHISADSESKAVQQPILSKTIEFSQPSSFKLEKQINTQGKLSEKQPKDH